MKSLSLSLIVSMIVVLGCKEPISDESQTKKAVSIDSLFQAYYQFKLRINPIEATKAGENKYNDYVANFISDDYQQDLITNYSQFLEVLESIDSTMVSPSQWMSMQVMEWDCKIKLEGLTNELVTIASPIYDLPNFELMPVLQIQSLHLYFAQLAGGASVQPFKTVQDYDNWLSRIDDYLAFLDTCMVKMKEGMTTGVFCQRH